MKSSWSVSMVPSHNCCFDGGEVEGPELKVSSYHFTPQVGHEVHGPCRPCLSTSPWSFRVTRSVPYRTSVRSEAPDCLCISGVLRLVMPPSLIAMEAMVEEDMTARAVHPGLRSVSIRTLSSLYCPALFTGLSMQVKHRVR